MAAETITSWLRRKRRNDCGISLLLFGLAFVAGLGALVLIFCLFWFASLLVAPAAMGGKHLSVGWPLAVTLLVTALLFIDALHSRRDDLSNVALWLLRESFGIGPRLILESWRRANRAVQFARLDVHSCAKVLAYMAARRASVSRDELLRACPGLDWSKLRSQLLLVEGVLFLRADFSRVTLSQPLRLRLRRLLPRAKQVHEPAHETAESAPVTEPEKLSSYEILGVSPSASLAEIKTAYRARVKECHPDRFAGMDPASLRQAEEWTKALNAAYAALVAERARALSK
jgi:DnaJ-domain-containing protein 1